ncbi:uncharacterized protein GGS22DRAFT_168046 [Annulohypoxylon maeteangense]|uniref:uncharacterized protein n=1 Tax=Annulohypoxylon maeteangense TaxID=1927788 RepID=UPI0020072601|nr:uncharacterized protein GGS22DRAFT_168046 [Annulohypoxylon maeteangense]KAI0883176.1 hypothetical protein GGS22DRAFT_168046 [Annulohypoxylon maeteangense]
MNISLAARCAGRARPSLLSGSRTACLRPHSLPIRNQHQISSRILSPRTQPFSVLSARQNTTPQNPPPGAQQPQQHPGPHPGRGQQYKTWILFNLAGLSAVIMLAIVLKSAPTEKNPVINTSSFSPFTITSKEQVSPTAFVITVRAGDSSPGENKPGSTASLKDAWAHGIWSVETKQPQLQIARHYTPLPSEPSNDEAELRFLIRKLDGGEMSTYLSKLDTGSQVHLRGPHPSFDVEKRLGSASNVVFLAGGTGIAPALQVAAKLLETPVPEEEKPYVSILWANRRSTDALGRGEVSGAQGTVQGWVKSLRGDTADRKERRETVEQEEASLARQLREMRERHPQRFRVAYFVDEEGGFIGAEDLQAALSPPPPSRTQSSEESSALSPTRSIRESTPLLPPASTCPWHSPTLLTKLPDANDASRYNINCTCARAAPKSYTTAHPTAKPGTNLVFVSGPDGFVGSYAGPKRWFGGGEMQGVVDGVLKRVLEEREKKEEGGERENWMVLKL